MAAETLTIIDNKTIVRSALDAVVRKDINALNRYWSRSYIEHDPSLPDGLEAIKDLMSSVIKFELVRIIGEDDLVVTHGRIMGRSDGPLISFDIFCVQNGKIQEHWNVVQREEQKTVSGHSMLDGPTQVIDKDRTLDNKALIEGLVENILQKGKGDVTLYISPMTYIQHNPGIGDGLAGLSKALEDMARAGQELRYRCTYRYVADGNFVFAHSEGEMAGKHMAFADLFRVQNALAVEHWDTVQEVPTRRENENGMF